MAEARPKNHFALIALVLALGTAALYWPINNYPFILYDDEQYVTTNRHVTTGLSWTNCIWAFTNGEAANWHPLTWLSHQLDCTLFGLNAGGHHFVSLVFHVVNALLLFIFLRRTTGSVWRSALVAALFAWHPLRVESVAWVSERKDVLSMFFWLLTLMAYARYVELARAQSSKAKACYVIALIFFVGGLMSKPMVVTLPFVLLLLDFWPLNRVAGLNMATGKRLLLEKIPFFMLAAAGSAVTYLVQAHGGALWQTPLLDRLANAVIAYARYVAKTFWPHDLAIIYSHPKQWPVALAVGATLMLLVWTSLCVRRWREKPYLMVGWFWFLGTLVPTIGIVQVGAQSMADRYTYIPCIGLFVTLVWGLADYLMTKPRGKNIFLLVAGGALAGCLLATAVQITYWRDNVTLFRRAMTVSQNNYVAANCLGKAYEKIGEPTYALVLYRASVEAEPRFPQSQFNYSMMLLRFGQRDEALKHLQAAAALSKNNPDIQFDLGIFFTQQGSWTNAVSCFRRALTIEPRFAAAQKRLDEILAANPELR